MPTLTGAVQLGNQPLSPALIEMLQRAAAPAACDQGGSGGHGSPLDEPRSVIMLSDSSKASAAITHYGADDRHWPAVLTWDGRLDNGDEIASYCGLSPGSGDAEIVLAAYAKWNEQCLAKLVGDFAFVLWDAIRQKVVLARDSFGTRPLFYFLAGELVLWSSELRHIVQVTGTAPELDDRYAAGFLTGSEDLELTAFRGARSVAPASVVVVSPSGPTVRQYWKAAPDSAPLHESNGAYEARFRELLAGGIAARLRGGAAVFAELSGGLDSSSIVCLAADILSQERRQLTTVTYVYPGCRTSYETRFSSEVERQTGLTNIHLEAQRVVAPIFEAPPPIAPNPTWIFDGLYSALGEHMRAAGATTLLSGHGGDHLMMHAARRAPHLADLLRHGKWLTLLRDLRGYRSQWNLAYGELLWTSVLWPMLPMQIRLLTSNRRAALPPWFNTSFARRTRLTERWMIEHGNGGFRTCAGAYQFGLLRDAISLASACYHRSRFGVDVTYPYLHRPLVELLLAIPSDQKINSREMRSVQRRALRGVLPEIVRTRTTKSGLGEVLCRAVQREWRRVRQLATNAQVVERGYVDRQGWTTALERVRHGVDEHVYAVSRALVLEAWLRART